MPLFDCSRTEDDWPVPALGFIQVRHILLRKDTTSYCTSSSRYEFGVVSENLCVCSLQALQAKCLVFFMGKC